MAGVGHLMREIEQGFRAGNVPDFLHPVLIDSATSEEVSIAALRRMPWRTQSLEAIDLSRSPSDSHRSTRCTTADACRRPSRTGFSVPPTAQERLTRLPSLINDDSHVWEIRKTQRNGSSHVYVGRARRNDIVIPDETVSSMHARVELNGQQLVLYDCESANGTFVNRRRLAIRSRHPLMNGDCIRFGKRVFFFLDPVRLRQFLKIRLAKALAKQKGDGLNPRRRSFVVRPGKPLKAPVASH